MRLFRVCHSDSSMVVGKLTDIGAAGGGRKGKTFENGNDLLRPSADRSFSLEIWPRPATISKATNKDPSRRVETSARCEELDYESYIGRRLAAHSSDASSSNILSRKPD